jgi:hypothetical protein
LFDQFLDLPTGSRATGQQISCGTKITGIHRIQVAVCFLSRDEKC